MKTFRILLGFLTAVAVILVCSVGVASALNVSLVSAVTGVSAVSIVTSIVPIQNGVFLSLLGTRMQNFIQDTPLDKFEMRPSRWGALDLFIAESNNPSGIINPQLKELAMRSIGSTIQIPVIDDEDVSIGNARTLTIAASENSSSLVSISFATYAWGFTLVPALYSNNEISMQRDFNAKMTKYLNKFADTLDEAAIATMMLKKTQVFNDTLAYSKEANTIVAKYAERETIIGDINPMMAANDCYNTIHLVGNTGMESIIRNLSEQGLYNEKNKQLQYSDKVLHFSNRVSNPAGKYASAYAVNEGSLGMLTRLEREAILNTKTNIGYEWGQIMLPVVGIPCGTYYYETVEDMKDIAGAASVDMTRARVQHYGYSVDVAFMVAYNSNESTRPQPIMKITVNTAATDADVTDPTVAFTSSSGLTNVVVTFSEAICVDKAGTLASGDIKAMFGLSAHGTITSATIDATHKVVTFVLVNTAFAENDYLQTVAPFYDANGKAIAANTHVAKCSATPLWIAA